MLPSRLATLCDLILVRAMEQPQATAYVYQPGKGPEIKITYEQLYQRAAAVAAHLQEVSQPGDRVLLAFPASLDFIYSFFGCLFSGRVAVPVYPPRNNRNLERLAAIVRDCDATVSLTTEATLIRLGGLLGQFEDFDGVAWVAPELNRTSDIAANISATDLAFLQYTSGSTGDPKGVMVHHEHLVANLDMMRRAFRLTPESKLVSWLPMFHDMGLIGGVLLPCFAGIEAILSAPASFLQAPVGWLETISQHRATHSGGPNFAYDLCTDKVTDEALAQLDLSSWQVATNGAEPVRAQTLDRFGARFAAAGFRADALYPCYGLAEATLFVSGGHYGESTRANFDGEALAQDRAMVTTTESETNRRLVASGIAAEDLRVRVVSAAGQALEEGEVGEIWVSGPSIAAGYWRRPELSELVFRAALAEDDGHRYLRTGDLGFQRGIDCYITGRLKDVVIIRGRNYYPQDIEACAAEAHEALTGGSGAAFSLEVDGEEKLVIVHEVGTRKAQDWSRVVHAVRGAVAKQFDLQLHALAILQYRAIPKTSSGKIRRRTTRAEFLAGSLYELHRWQDQASTHAATPALPAPETRTTETLLVWLKSWLGNALGVSAAEIEDTLIPADSGLDSVGMIRLLNELERTIGAVLQPAELYEMPSLRALAERLCDTEATKADVWQLSEAPSSGQMALWRFEQVHRGTPVYHVARALELEGVLDAEALERAFVNLIDRHESLRTSFIEVDGQPRLHVAERVPFRLEQQDAALWNDETIAQYAERVCNRPFELATAPLLRAHLLRRGPEKALLIVNMHHLITDFWSMSLLWRDLEQSYTAHRAGKTPELASLTAYRAWPTAEAALLAEHGEQLRDFWQNYLQGANPSLELYPKRATEAGLAGAVCYASIGARTARAVRQFCQQQGIQPHAFFLAAWFMLLEQYSGQTELTVGIPTFGRHGAAFDEVVGYFVNTLPIRLTSKPGITLQERLLATRESLRQAQAHGQLPYNEIAACHGEGHNLFATMFDYQQELAGGTRDLVPLAFGQGTGRTALFADLLVNGHPLKLTAAMFEATLTVADFGDEFRFALEHRLATIDEKRAERLLADYQHLVSQIIVKTEQPLAALPLAEEAQACLQAWSGEDTFTQLPQGTLEQILARAKTQPERPALLASGEVLDYANLAHRIEHTAAQLHTAGLRADDRVALYLEAGPNFTMATLACWYLGAAILPLDQKAPHEHIAYLLADSGPRLLIADKSIDTEAVDVVAWASLQKDATHQLDAVAHEPQRLAYLIYTSGSTGRPKGVAVSHGALAAHGAAVQQHYQLCPEDRVLQFASCSFDVSMEEIYPSLVAGAAVVYRERDKPADPIALMEEASRADISVLNLPSSFWHECVRALEKGLLQLPPRLRLMIMGNEEVLPEVAELWWRLTEGRIATYNAYGPTEATITATLFAFDGQTRTRMPIGRPIRGTRTYLLDDALNRRPLGTLGQLYLAGAGLARGYRGRPAETASRFLPDPFAAEPGARMYCTGDQASYDEAGRLLFHGRADMQVKLRGFRIELGEIEQHLLALPGVGAAVAQVRGLGKKHRIIIAFLEAAGGELNAPDLLDQLRQRMPAYMIPAKLEILERLPRLPGGKVDRKRLEQMEIGEAATPNRQLETSTDPTEAALLAVWREGFGRDEIGLTDNYFELGGDSILAISLARLAAREGLSLTPALIFAHQTLAELAPHVTLREQIEHGPLPLPGGMLPLTPIQHWFFEQELAQPHHWNQGIELELREALDPERVLEAVRAVLCEHDSFRLRFTQVDDTWLQHYAPAEAQRVELELQHGLDEAGITTTLSELQDGFDLEQGPLCGGLLLTHDSQPTRLFLVAHHLVVDAVSWRILVRDIEARLENEASEIPADGYGWWARLMAQFGSTLETPTSNEAPAFVLPLDDETAQRQEAGCRIIEKRVMLGKALRQPGATNHGPAPETLLLAALGATLAQWTDNTSVTLDVEAHGRNQPWTHTASQWRQLTGKELDGRYQPAAGVGWYTTMTPLSFKVGEDIGTLLRNVKTASGSRPLEGHGAGLWAQHGQCAAAHTEVSFNFLGELEHGEETRLLAWVGNLAGVRGPTNRRTHLFEIDSALDGDALHIWWSYSEGVHQHATVARLLEAWMTQLQRIIDHCVAHANNMNQLLVVEDFPLAKADLVGCAALIEAHREEQIEDIFPLSPEQESMIFHHLYAPDSGVTVEQTVLDFDGALDPEAFRQAWQVVQSRHQSLRATYHWEGLTRPLQVIHTTYPLPFVQEDWRDLDAAASEARLQELLETDRRQGFDPRRPALMRLTLIRREDEVWTLLWSHHHLVLDGWCINLVMGELEEAYRALLAEEIPQLPAAEPFGRYIGWLCRQDQSETERFWRGYLEGYTSPIRLTEKNIEAGEHGKAYERTTLSFSDADTHRIEALARQSRVTVNTLVLGAWAVLLRRFSGLSDVVFGTTVSGRVPAVAGVDAMIGCFMNTLPLRVAVDEAETPAELFRQIQFNQARIRDFEYTSLASVRNWSQVPRESALFDLYETIVIFENYPFDDARRQTFAGLDIRHCEFEAQLDYPISLYVFPEPRLTFSMLSDTAAISPDRARRLTETLYQLLLEMVAHGETSLDRLAVLSETDRKLLFENWNPTRHPFQREATLRDLFDQQVARTPDVPAVSAADGELSYVELDAWAYRIAGRLLDEGIAAEQSVALFCERSVRQLAAIAGIHKAGGAFLPLDPGYPKQWLDNILEDTGARVLLTQRKLVDELPPAYNGAVLFLDDLHHWPQAGPHQLPPLAPQNIAYIIYTSGSTGKPKGVVISHGSMVSHATDCRDNHYTLVPGDRVLQFSSINFDISMEQIFPAMISGACLVYRDPEIWDPTSFIQRAAELKLTVINLPTAYWHELVRAWDQSGEWPDPNGVKLFVMGGERMLPDPVCAWMKSPMRDVLLLNAYGPAETTVTSTLHRLPREKTSYGEESIPIGALLANRECYILDRKGRPLPPTVVGEIAIGGHILARGYLNRPALSAERFVPNTLGSGAGQRLYRTGDLGYYRENGQLCFTGRLDHQVKIRGYRIEPSEVEHVLSKLDGVGEGVVVARELRDGQTHIVAYLTIKPGHALSVSAVRDYLAAKVPPYMVPSHIVVMELLPKSPNGKIYREKLPDPLVLQPNDEAHREPPHGPVEEALAKLWANLLGLELATVGREDDFFEKGGHSLVAIQLLSRIRAELGVNLALRELFQHTTLASIAAAVEAAMGENDEGPKPLHREGLLTLGEGQKRLWFLQQLDPESTAYNIPLVIEATGDLKADRVEAAFAQIIARHESLRTRFVSQDGLPHLVIAPENLDWQLTERRAEAGEAEAGEAEELALERCLAEVLEQPFDLERGPLFRGLLLRTGEQTAYLVLVLHHLIFDGWSAGVLIDEFSRAYRGETLEALPVQYHDWAMWYAHRQDRDDQRNTTFWKAELAELEPLQLPTDAPRNGQESAAAAHCVLELDAQLVADLEQSARDWGVTPFNLLLTAFHMVLARVTGQTDFAVGTPDANRNCVEAEALIGFFVNTRVLRNRIEPATPFAEAARSVHQRAARAMAHGDMAFEKLVAQSHAARNLGNTPLFQVMFVYENAAGTEIELPDLELRARDVRPPEVKFDLTMRLQPLPTGLEAALEYRADLFEAETMASLLELFARVLREGLADGTRTAAGLTALRGEALAQIESLSRPKPPVQPVNDPLAAWLAHVSQAGDREALVVGEERLTHKELFERASQLAGSLQARGIGLEDAVALLLPRSTEMVVAMLACGLAGAAWIPLEQPQPATRIEQVLVSAAPKLVLTLGQPSVGDHPVLDLSQPLPPRDFTLPELPGAALHYIIYTSGSTGTPKGVGVTRANLAEYLRGFLKRSGLPEGLRFATVSTFSADLGLTMVYAALASGGCLHVIDKETLLDGALFADYMTQHQVEVLKLTPSHLEALMAGPHRLAVLPSRMLVVGGEASPADLGRLAAEVPGLQVRNHYGPTEATIGVTMYTTDAERVPAAASLPIGQPFDHAQTWILDEDLAPCDLGRSGDLYLGGVTLARGYLGRPAATALAFVPHPFATQPGERLYRSGDRARWLREGAVEFLGRADFQIKIRGYRVEPGEVEAALLAFDGVKQALVANHPDTQGRPRLAAWVAHHGGAELSVAGLKQRLGERLPSYMVPERIAILDELPRNANGKVDRGLLHRTIEQEPTETTEPASFTSETQCQLAQLWQALLGTAVRPDDNFFALGGQSLQVTELAARVEQHFGVRLRVREIFEQPGLRQMASAIETQQQAGASAEQTLEDLMASLDGMSDEEVALRLAELEASPQGVES